MPAKKKGRKTWKVDTSKLPDGLVLETVNVTLERAKRDKDTKEITSGQDRSLTVSMLLPAENAEGVLAYQKLMADNGADGARFTARTMRERINRDLSKILTDWDKLDADKRGEQPDVNTFIPVASRIRTIDPEEAAGEVYTRKVAELRATAKAEGRKVSPKDLASIYSECFPD